MFQRNQCTNKIKKLKENLFIEKFHQLDSQDYCDDIRWSSSDASDENGSNKINYQNSASSHHRKRKRRKKQQENLSNLNITYISMPEQRNEVNNNKSPILSSKFSMKSSRSPILTSQCLNTLKNNVHTALSPILTIKTQVEKDNEKTSPILLCKRHSRSVSPKVKKKLFCEQLFQNTDMKNNKVPQNCNNEFNINKNDTLKSNSNYTNEQSQTKYLKNDFEQQTATILCSSEKMAHVKPKSQLDLMKKVQSYFESNFSSESTSQQSISECETITPQNNSKSSDDIEISNSITKTKDLPMPQEITCITDTSTKVKKKKSIKYEKGGLAYRLANLLKKQNINVSLWHHEKFLAKNSNFIIPKSEHILFRIKNVHFKFGCYSIDAKDINNDEYLLLINMCHVNSNCVITSNFVLKLYKPYDILDIGNKKIVVNICKFECIPIM
ncbi:putative uncharacterized protein DDB_G0274405 [Battus philenor]|uniref:putative uncharacterized protein DDB_G0274405 n=1 Tax=Battus philenor TaxID=42288 RepID=UPI0035D0CB4A